MNAKVVLHQLQKKLQNDGHITEADVADAREAIRALGGTENMALYSLLKRRIEVPPIDENLV
ncbi:hypothetical protein ACTL32_18340 [Planococcus sp. FY231025]|uniref:hypothetical protein n=1 Tax=Planococcus sp. FY231025 TaxID=3455699 RepID=UPI003F8E2206